MIVCVEMSRVIIYQFKCQFIKVNEWYKDFLYYLSNGLTYIAVLRAIVEILIMAIFFRGAV